MSRFAFRAALAFLALAAACTLAAPRAHAIGASADSTVEGYVRSMADSTDAFFGITAQPTDTTGVDSLRSYFVEHPKARPGRSRLDFAPNMQFNRVLGYAPGATAGFGSASRFGRAEASLQWAMGADLWLGAGELERRWSDPTGTNTWSVRARAGRDVAALNRDLYAPGLSSLYAFFGGGDRTHYERLDGALLDVAHAAPGWSAGVTARDQLESPLSTTATWYFGGHHPVIVRNDPATLVRVHEAGAWSVLRLPHLPYQVEGHAWRGGGGLGGDVSYTRVSAAIGGASALGRHLSLATQVGWGRLTGAALPQEAFYLGGSTLYSLPENSLQGTGRALGRAELMLDDPLQRLIGLEREPTFPMQLSVFAGSASRWGFDPATGRAQLTTRDWPDRTQWRSEAGFSVVYRPGLPDPDSFVRFVVAYPMGPGSHATSLSVYYTRSLNLLRRR